ncbi:hypothetical protein CYLTODRAFT_363399, partial [Cylindrobasidium torrendii FP15055 ss-10]
LGDIMASTLADFKNDEGKKATGKSRFYRIVITKAVYLIWPARCHRVILDDETGEVAEPYLPEELRNTFRKHFNKCIKLDIALSGNKHYKRRQKTVLVLAIWTRVVEGENLLVEDWSSESEVY